MRFETKHRTKSLAEKPADCSRRVLAIGGTFFDPRSIFDPIMRDQMSSIRKIDNFSTLHEDISIPINRRDIKLSLACSPFNSEQNQEQLPLIDGIFMTHTIPEGNSVTLIGKIA